MIELDNFKFPTHHMLCVDAKAFYSSIECVERGLDPLKAYMVVVGDKNRSGSVVLASSPMMKSEFKIKTGSRLYECPSDSRIHIVNAQMRKYLHISMEITKILNQFAPLEAIFAYSIDENFVCLDGCEKLFGDAWQAAYLIQQKILTSTGIPNSIGIGDNRFLSKVIMDTQAKKSPIGIAECRYKDVPTKLWDLPIEDVWGIGFAMKKRLNQLGIYILGDLAKASLPMLKKKFGVMGEQLYYHANGIDLSPVFLPWRETSNKGYSHGITLFRNYNLFEVRTVLIDLLDNVTQRLREAKSAAKTIFVSIGYSRDVGGSGFSKSRTLQEATNITEKFLLACVEMLDDAIDEPIRNVYVSASNLVPEDQIQVNLFDDPILEEKRHRLGGVRDQLQKKYGHAVLFRASSFSKDGIAVDRVNKIGGHSQ